MEKFHTLISNEIRSELSIPLADICVRLDENKQTQEKQQLSLEEMVLQVMQLQMDVKDPEHFSPVEGVIRGIEATRLDAYKEDMQRLEDRIAGDLSQILAWQAIRGSELQQVQTLVAHEVRMEINSAFQKRYAVDVLAKECNTNMAKMIGLQVSLSDRFEGTSMELHKFHLESLAHNAMIEPTIQNELSVVNTLPEHFNRVILQVIRTQDVLNQDTKVVLQELGKVQQALNVDFAHVLDDMHDEIHQMHVTQDLKTSKIGRAFAIEDKKANAAAGGAYASEQTAEGLLDAPKVGLSSPEGGAPATETTAAKPTTGVRVAAKRFRHTLTQTDGGGLRENDCQTDPVVFQEKKKEKKVVARRQSGFDADGNPVKPKAAKPKPVGIDAEEMKKNMRAKLIKPQYNVQDFYHDTGCAQKISTNGRFGNFTLFVIAVNAVWISIDTDLNSSETLIDAHPVFIVAENLFCAFFAFEIFARFFSFNGKRHCLRDAWFVFDSILVTIMIIETWVVPVSMLASDADSGASTGDASILRMVRMARLVRMSRLAKLLKAIPELSILIKSISSASRSVTVFFVLWMLMSYVFGIVCRMLSDGAPIGVQYFDTVPQAMMTLFLDGILPGTAAFCHDLINENFILFPIVLFFIFLAGITVMYMLVGVIIGSVGAIAAAEKEGAQVSNLAEGLRFAFGTINRDVEAPISLDEFNALLAEPDVAHVIIDAGVDLAILIDTSEMIFEDPDTAANGLTFATLIETVLNLRGSLPCTVKDTKEQIKTLKKVILNSSESLMVQLDGQFAKINERMDTMIEVIDDLSP